MDERLQIDERASELLHEFRSLPPSDHQAFNSRLPVDEEDQRHLAHAFDLTRVEALNAGDLTCARDAFWLLFTLRLAIVKRHAADRAAIRDFATAEDLLGLTPLELRNLGPAEQMLTEALKYRSGLHSDEPSDSHAAHLYGVALWHMAKLERAKSNPFVELTWVERARAHLAQVVATWPNPFSAAELQNTERRWAEIERKR